MAKELLIDQISLIKIDTNKLNESIDKNSGRLIIKGVVQRADAKNQNGRIYPRKVLERETQRYLDNEVKEKRAISELDHPDSSIVTMANGCIHMNKLWWQGNDLMGEMEVLCDTPTLPGTPMGNILAAYLKRGLTVGISSRGLGSVKENKEQGGVIVEDDFELVAFDIVSNPSTKGAFLKPINESKNSKVLDVDLKYNKVSKLIKNILS